MISILMRTWSGRYPGAFWVTAVIAAAIGLASATLVEQDQVIVGLAVSLLCIPVMQSVCVPIATSAARPITKALQVLAWFCVSMLFFAFAFTARAS